MSLHALAQDMSSKGRYGDSMLVHMSPNEVAGLHALALHHGEKLTINPETGLPEAFSLKKLLPAVLGFALNTFAPGLGTAVGSALGASAAVGTAALVGGAYGLAKGSLKEGLLAGLGAYGGAGLAQGLAASGANQIASEEVLRQQVGQLPLEGSSAAENFLSTPSAQATGTGSTTTMADATGSASPVAEVVLDPVTTTTPLPVQGGPIDSASLSTAGYTPPTGLESLSRGAQSIYDRGGVGEFAKLNKNNLYAIGASSLLSPEDEEKMSETQRDPGYIRPARYDWRTGKYEYFEPVKASEWGTRNMSEYTYAGDPNARTPIGAKAGGLMALANGGAIAFDGGGGVTDEELRQQQAAAAAYFEALKQSEMATASAPASTTSAPASTTSAPATTTSAANTSGPTTGPEVVVGGGGPDNYKTPGFIGDNNREYTPEQRLGINQAWIRSQTDPDYGVKGLMADMEKTGVTARDLALSRGLDQNTVNQYLIRGGASGEFGGINKNWDTKKQDDFIKWQNSQPNPYGQGTLGDMYKAQGLSDTDPRRRAQAQEMIEREERRNAMRAGAGAPPVSGPGGTPTTPVGRDPVVDPARPNPRPPTDPYNPDPKVPVTRPISEVTSGGSRAAYQYLFNEGAYPVNPYLPPNTPIAKPIYETPGYEMLKPKPSASLYSTDPGKKPTGNPGTGMEWVWKEDQKKWVAQKIGSSTTTPPTTPTTPNEPTSGATGGLMPRRMALGGLGALAGGGQAGYNLGGYSDGGRLLRGPGDGVSDDIPATIGNKQPARLADGEFVVPARIVSELGNGSTEAVARKLYAMMDRVQRARGKTTGKKRVAVNSRSEKYLPA